jgi:alpha-tubulin suppressor-like RCC1 family protein
MKTTYNKVLVAAIVATFSMNAQAIQTKVAGGFNHNVFVNDSGDVYAAGNNRLNQVGAMASREPIYSGGSFLMNRDVKYKVPVHTGLVGVKYVAAAGNRSVALKEDGSVYFWGAVSNLVQGTPTDSYVSTVPQAVNISGVIDVAVGGTKMLMLKEGDVKGSGVVYEWDFNTSHTPTVVANLPENITSIAAGYRFAGKGQTTNPLVNLEHFRALSSDGSVYVWGHNDKGQLGLGNFDDVVTPVKVPNVVAKAVAVGASMGYIVTTNGDVYQSGWINVDVGKAGNPSLVKVQGAFGVDFVVGSNNGAFAINNNGSVSAWGWHNYIGSGGYLRTDYATPVQEAGTNVQYVGASNETFTVVSSRGYHSIGAASSGQLGDDSFVEKHAFPNASLVNNGTIASVEYQLSNDISLLSWVDPVVLKIKQCIDTAADPYSCEVGAEDTQLASLRQVETDLNAENAALKAQLAALQNQLTTTETSLAKVSSDLVNSEFNNGNLSTNLKMCSTDLVSSQTTLSDTQAALIEAQMKVVIKEVLVEVPVDRIVETYIEVPVDRVIEKIVYVNQPSVSTGGHKENHHEYKNHHDNDHDSKHDNNGHGNGDQAAPGKSANHNNAENATSLKGFKK